MKKSCQLLIAVLLAFVVTVSPVVSAFETPVLITAQAHSGRTDSSGGHKDNKNKSGLGSYHYHCGGYPAHLHSGGVCPYKTKVSTTASTTTVETVSKDTETVKAVQGALNERGYDCGTPDGIMGKKTKSALMKFQEDNGLTVDGIIGEQVTIALEINLQ